MAPGCAQQLTVGYGRCRRTADVRQGCTTQGQPCFREAGWPEDMLALHQLPGLDPASTAPWQSRQNAHLGNPSSVLRPVLSGNVRSISIPQGGEHPREVMMLFSCFGRGYPSNQEPLPAGVYFKLQCSRPASECPEASVSFSCLTFLLKGANASAQPCVNSGSWV